MLRCLSMSIDFVLWTVRRPIFIVFLWTVRRPLVALFLSWTVRRPLAAVFVSGAVRRPLKAKSSLIVASSSAVDL